MATRKLSQIALASTAPALTDRIIGVGGGATDLQYSLTQIQQTVSPPATQTNVLIGGTTSLSASTKIVLVNVAALVTLNLPDVNSVGVGGLIWIKDIGGNATNFNITVTPFSIQTIDKLNGSFVIVENRQILRLYVLNDLSGWFAG